MADCLGSFYLVKSRGFVHLVAQGLVSMMSQYITVMFERLKVAQDRLL